jgi:hypothetical protein
VSDLASAYKVFETLDDRGLDLTVADLLKNYLCGGGDRRGNENYTLSHTGHRKWCLGPTGQRPMLPGTW